MTNFAFLPTQFNTIKEAATNAECHIANDPRSACFQSRFALETIVHWLYRHDRTLTKPYDSSLGSLLYEPKFQDLMPPQVFAKVKLIHKMGNSAAHNRRDIPSGAASQVVKDLHHLCRWLIRLYAQGSLTDFKEWDDGEVPYPLDTNQLVPREELEKLEAKRTAENSKMLELALEKDALDTELQKLRDQLAETKVAAEQQEDAYDYSEAETRNYLIDVDLYRAGWALGEVRDKEYEVTGMPNNKGFGYVDYVLWGDDGKPLAVVEAKKSTVDPSVGQQQAKLYADCLETMHDQRPLIFYTNGYDIYFWDDKFYPPRKVGGFYTKGELQGLITRRTQRENPVDVAVKKDIAGRYYQERAIKSIASHFGVDRRRKALLVMATGTGKTRTSIALVDVLQRAGWVKRALFLADRRSLVKQAVNAFKEHLPQSSPVNLLTEKDATGRVYVATYPTMLNLIDQTKGDEPRFGVGHFDLIVIDEAHRSVYQKYGAIFRYFDSLLVGLTATPREEVDRNTYELFDLEYGVPTDAYELDTAVNDGFLVPPRAKIVDLRFPRDGIDYDQLSDEEKEHWESLDWGDDAVDTPDRVNAASINKWLFNEDTVDKVLKHLMEFGHHVDGGDRLAKTIIFARNNDHAEYIEERFNEHYPKYAGHFARVISYKQNYAESLIESFEKPNDNPHIAISVDMLDTGIDVPPVSNLVFFKPVYSKIKFWQMIGRGTRLCLELFGPGDDKADFRVFDFCYNFDFFKENPEGIEGSGGIPIGTRLFRLRVQLLKELQKDDAPDQKGQLGKDLVNVLHGEVSAMNTANFLVRERLESVEPYKSRDKWSGISESDASTLQNEVAGLPSEQELDDIEERLFDVTALKMQIAVVEGDAAALESQRTKVVDIAASLEEKTTIPAVKVQLAYLSELQDPTFWEDINVNLLEEMRLRLRSLMSLLEKGKKKIVYSNIKDEVMGVRDDAVIDIPRMTGAQYEKKVTEYLRKHKEKIAIQRLYHNQALTEQDLSELEKALVAIGEAEGPDLLENLLERNQAPTIAWFVRSIVGLDRNAAKEAFAEYLDDRSLNERQIRFVELVIDQLTARGVMQPAALYESPFSGLHSGGPDELFANKAKVINGIFNRIERLASRLQAQG